VSHRHAERGRDVEPFEADGQWWLPQSPDEKVHGRLAVSGDGRATLSLIGAFQDFEISAGDLEGAGVYPRILGISEDKAYTLEDCFQIHRKTPFLVGGLDSERVLVNQVFRGAHFAPDEPLDFHRLNAAMDWLAYWVGRGGIEDATRHSAQLEKCWPGALAATAIRSVESQVCRGHDGATIKLSQSWGMDGDGVVERRLTQDFYFTVEHVGLVSSRALVEQMGDLQDLVSIGTGRVAAFRSLNFQHPDVIWPPEGERTHEVPIDFFANWNVVNDQPTKLLHHFQMFFTFEEFGGMEGIERWLLAVNRHGSALGRVMNSHYSKATYASDRLLHRTAAIEAFDRVGHPEYSKFAVRVQRCADRAGVPFEALVGDVAAWVSALREARDDVAHHRPGIASGGAKRRVLGDSAYWLFVLCMLRDADAPPVVFQRIVEHADFDFLRVRLGEALAPGAARRP
jgi:hypothetical protein